MICTRQSPHSRARADGNTRQQHSPLFPTIGLQIQKFALKFTL